MERAWKEENLGVSKANRRPRLCAVCRTPADQIYEAIASRRVPVVFSKLYFDIDSSSDPASQFTQIERPTRKSKGKGKEVEILDIEDEIEDDESEAENGDGLDREELRRQVIELRATVNDNTRQLRLVHLELREAQRKAEDVEGGHMHDGQRCDACTAREQRKRDMEEHLHNIRRTESTEGDSEEELQESVQLYEDLAALRRENEQLKISITADKIQALETEVDDLVGLLAVEASDRQERERQVKLLELEWAKRRSEWNTERAKLNHKLNKEGNAGADQLKRVKNEAREQIEKLET